VSENLRIVEKCTLFVHLPGKLAYSSVHFTQLLYEECLVLEGQGIRGCLAPKKNSPFS
jgi:hypothetical protein